MRAIFFALTLLIAEAVGGTARAEIVYPWCRHSIDGGTNCGFSSFEQCGGGAYCNENPRYQGPAPKPSPRTPRRR